ncbi:unnamed protein product, partial [Protopolystoma xenopodis]
MSWLSCSRFIDGICSRSEDLRIRTAIQLRHFVGSELKELSVQNYIDFIDSMCNELINIMHVGDLFAKSGAVIAMGCLAEVDFMNMHGYCIRFAAKILSNSAPMDLYLATLEARLLGQFCLLFSELPETLLHRARKTLCDFTKNENRQFCILLIREIALHTPNRLHQNIGVFMLPLLAAFRDRQMVNRELAAMSVRAAFAVIAEREINHYGGFSLSSSQQRMLNVSGSGGRSIILTGDLSRHNAMSLNTVPALSLRFFNMGNMLIPAVDPNSSAVQTSYDCYRRYLNEALQLHGEISSELASFLQIDTSHK